MQVDKAITGRILIWLAKGGRLGWYWVALHLRLVHSGQAQMEALERLINLAARTQSPKLPYHP